MSVYSGYPHYSFVQKFEVGHDSETLRLWYKDNWHYSLYVAFVYSIAMFVLKEYMKNRPAAKIRKAVVVWDATLALFSICGMFRMLPEIVYVFNRFGMEWTVCDNTANNVSVFWAWAYAFSKGPELLDTVFIVLKKRKLTFLHLSHHALTLIITWFFFAELPAVGRWMVSVNYTIHSFMYSYFALKAAKLNVPVKVSMILTSAQILQMVVCGLACSFALRANVLGRECSTNTITSIAGLAFSLFLLYLFCSFFVQKYKMKKPKMDKVK